MCTRIPDLLGVRAARVAASFELESLLLFVLSPYTQDCCSTYHPTLSNTTVG